MSEDNAVKPVVSALDAAFTEFSPSASAKAAGHKAPPPGLDEKFGAQLAPLGAAMGLKHLGATAVILPPGKRAFPMHAHYGNDEMFVILEGEGVYQIGQEQFPVKLGDVCGAPAGGAEAAHQIINTSQAPLRYLAISSKRDPDVVVYPQSDKFAAIVRDGARALSEAPFVHIGERADKKGYWDGEGE